MQNAQHAPIPFPTLSHYDDAPELSWIKRRLLDLGIITMANAIPKPPGFYVNFTTLASLTVIIGFIAGGFWWTWTQGKEAGIAIGEQRTVNQQLNNRLTKAEQDAAEAQKLQTYSAGVADTHGKKKEK